MLDQHRAYQRAWWKKIRDNPKKRERLQELYRISKARRKESVLQLEARIKELEKKCDRTKERRPPSESTESED
jgi:flagellar motor component MotA